jgi:phosphatidylglycerophosphate synthase
MDAQTFADEPMTTKPARGRVNESLLQPLERPALAWIAPRLPPWITSDGLTALGVAGALITLAGYALSNWSLGFLWLASLGLIIQWFGDSLDGTLARVRGRERPRYGYFIDHTTDIFTQLMIILGLGLLPFVQFEIACLTLIGYYMISIYEHIRANVTQTLRVSVGYLGPTEARVAVIALNTAAFFWPPRPVVAWWAPLTVVDLILLGFFALACVMVTTAYLTDLRKFSAEDPPRSSR